MKKITVSAPGKLMLFGEHSVVYEHPCIVTAVDTRMKATISVSDRDSDQIITPQVKKSNFVQKSIVLFKKQFSITQSVRVETHCDFPQKYGLGSSSAVTVAVLYGLTKLFNKKVEKHKLFDLSYGVVKNIQGVGSGFDIAAAIFGGTLYFVTGGKTIKPLVVENLPLIIGYTGIKADTSEIVKDLKKRFAGKETVRDELFEKITDIVNQAHELLMQNNWETLGNLMNKNQKHLETLGVSSDKLDALIVSARSTGAYGAKLSGAGGGDCMIALSPENKVCAVKKAIENVGGEIVTIKSNAEGVRVEL